MRPASHMPLADRITLQRRSALMARDSSLVTASTRPGQRSGSMPESRRRRVSSSKLGAGVSRKMPVASTASGLSTYTGKSSWPCTRLFCLIWRRKYSISWVRPTAKQGTTTLPPRSKVRCSTLASWAG